MSRLTIAIPTFRRPEDLKRAVGGVLEQASELAAGPTTEASGPRTDAEAGTEDDAAGATDAKGGAGEDVSDIEVLVIDNDAQGSGREAALAAAADAGVPVRFPADASVESGGMSVRYVVEERPGVAAVRNRALDETAERDLLIFIDDDEIPSPGWLKALVSTWRAQGCAAVTGPTPPAFEVDPSAWVVASGAFDSWGAADGAQVYEGLKINTPASASLEDKLAWISRVRETMLGA